MLCSLVGPRGAARVLDARDDLIREGGPAACVDRSNLLLTFTATALMMWPRYLFTLCVCLSYAVINTNARETIEEAGWYLLDLLILRNQGD